MENKEEENPKYYQNFQEITLQESSIVSRTKCNKVRILLNMSTLEVSNVEESLFLPSSPIISLAR